MTTASRSRCDGHESRTAPAHRRAAGRRRGRGCAAPGSAAQPTRPGALIGAAGRRDGDRRGALRRRRSGGRDRARRGAKHARGPPSARALSWELIWSPRSLRDLRRLDRQTADRIVTAVERYAATQYGNVRHLRASEPPTWRLRVGDWRVRFRFEAGSESEPERLLIDRVLHRREAYR